MASLSSSIRSSSSDSLLPDGDPNMFTLPSELDTFDLSVVNGGHPMAGPRFGESSIIELIEPFREGIAILFWVIIGDESGEDSASVEWWRLVQALLKSRPLECLGRDVADRPYEVIGSS